MSSSQVNNSTAIRNAKSTVFRPFSDPTVEDVHFQKTPFSYHYLVTYDNKVKSVMYESAARS